MSINICKRLSALKRKHLNIVFTVLIDGYLIIIMLMICVVILFASISRYSLVVCEIDKNHINFTQQVQGASRVCSGRFLHYVDCPVLGTLGLLASRSQLASQAVGVAQLA